MNPSRGGGALRLSSFVIHLHSAQLLGHSELDNLPAFTLAEVLITLGIIGIVAAMTLPALINGYQKKVTVTQLKKAYSALNQAIKMSELENGEYQYWEDGITMGAENYTNKYWKPYFKILKSCTTYQSCGYQTNYAWESLNGNSNTIFVSNPGYRIPFIIQDGTFVSVSTTIGSLVNPTSIIFVAINGPNKPNIVGKDFFVFERTKNGVLPFCNDKNETYVNRDCSAQNPGANYDVGFCCAKKIISAGWEIKPDYSW